MSILNAMKMKYSDCDLSQAHYLGAGANRYCIVSPVDGNVCLKIDLPSQQRRAKNWRQALQRFLSQRWLRFSENYIEWMAYQKLVRHIPKKQLEQIIAPCLALELHPEHQSILACRLVRHTDQSICHSLDHYLKQGLPLDLVQVNQALDRFTAQLLEYNIPLFDLNAGNLVVQHHQQELRLICIDIKSTYKSKEIIPISYWSKKLMHQKIVRRSQRLKQLMQKRMHRPE